jgi:hypothetical protein
MASEERDVNHIWLRQSVRFTQDGHERTIEIALPLPIGAPPHEVERLLAEADAGMARLRQHLDQQVAVALGSAEATPASAPVAALAMHNPTDALPGPSRAAVFVEPPQPAPVPPRSAAAPATPPAARIAEPSAPPPAASRAAEPAARPATATPASAAPAPATSTSARAPLSPAGEGQGGEDPLSRPDFLAETRTLGLTPPQVMERLGVRSLDGLNLREALDMLRRQLGASAASAPEPAVPPAAPASANGAAHAHAQAAATPPAATGFDEEEEFELVVLGPDMAPEDYGEELPYGDTDVAEPSSALEEVDGDADALDDVPDLGAALPAPPAPEPTRATATASFTPAQKARARELVAGFRAVAAGGSAARAQHTAFTNIVAGELGAETAETLVRGLWGQPPDRLGTDQLTAVVNWGKKDEFAAEAPVMLALLRAEQAHRSGASAPAPESPADEGEAPRPARATRKPASGGGRS